MAALERYSKITRRMWRDERFLALSAPKPNAQTLWIFLLTCPSRGGVPGLLAMGEAGLADEIRWPLAPFRKCLAELEEAQMVRVDRTAKLVWIPNSLRHNPPESPNVVLSWAAAWRELPDCALKDDAKTAIIAYLPALGEAFSKAFRQVIGLDAWSPYVEPSGAAKRRGPVKGPVKPSPAGPVKGPVYGPANQEQEQTLPLTPAERGDLLPSAGSGSGPDAPLRKFPPRMPPRPWESDPALAAELAASTLPLAKVGK